MPVTWTLVSSQNFAAGDPFTFGEETNVIGGGAALFAVAGNRLVGSIPSSATPWGRGIVVPAANQAQLVKHVLYIRLDEITTWGSHCEIRLPIASKNWSPDFTEGYEFRLITLDGGTTWTFALYANQNFNVDSHPTPIAVALPTDKVLAITYGRSSVASGSTFLSGIHNITDDTPIVAENEELTHDGTASTTVNTDAGKTGFIPRSYGAAYTFPVQRWDYFTGASDPPLVLGDDGEPTVADNSGNNVEVEIPATTGGVPDGEGELQGTVHVSATANFTADGSNDTDAFDAALPHTTYVALADEDAIRYLRYKVTDSATPTPQSSTSREIIIARSMPAYSLPRINAATEDIYFAVLGDSKSKGDGASADYRPHERMLAALSAKITGEHVGVNGGVNISDTSHWHPAAAAWPGLPYSAFDNLLDWFKAECAAVGGVEDVFLNLFTNNANITSGSHAVAARRADLEAILAEMRTWVFPDRQIARFWFDQGTACIATPNAGSSSGNLTYESVRKIDLYNADDLDLIEDQNAANPEGIICLHVDDYVHAVMNRRMVSNFAGMSPDGIHYTDYGNQELGYTRAAALMVQRFGLAPSTPRRSRLLVPFLI